MRYSKRPKISLIFIIELLLVPLLLSLFAFTLPPQYTETFLGAFSDKVTTLEATPGRRIILAGGSGAAFALRCDLLEEEFPGFSPVNLGMYAGLGSTVSLDAALGEVKEGDILIFLPEQSQQTLSLYFGSSSFWQAVDGHWDLLRILRRENLKSLLGEFPYFAAQKARLFFQNEALQGDGIYARSSFNRYGDIDSPLREKNTMPGGLDQNMPIGFSKELPGEEFIQRINTCASLCRERGAFFFFGFCPMNALAVSDEGLEEWEEWLSRELVCPLLGSPRDSILEPEWFFDTNFHLNSSGAIAFTAELAKQLKASLGLPTDVSIEVPQMPERSWISHGTSNTETESSEDSFFLYSAEGGEARLIGLTEEGRAQRELTVPKTLSDLPVVSLDPTVFSENTTLESLTLPEGLRQIPDGAFMGCTNLRQIILKGIRPSECTVGQRLLEGTDALLMVDEELYSSFVINYFWSVYAPWIRAYDPSSEPASPAPISSPSGEETSVASLSSEPSVSSVSESSVSEPSIPSIHYEGNGGFLPGGGTSLEDPIQEVHLRMNTLQGDSFSREGYALLGWNRAPDGSGEYISLGSRITPEPGLTLYAQWQEENSSEDFLWREEGGGAWITGYQGNTDACILPAFLHGLPVEGICSHAFENAPITTLFIPPRVKVLQPEAFLGSKVKTLYLHDSLETVSDDSFQDCKELNTLHLNAATPPVYSISYYASFADKYDRLLSLGGEKKLVIFAGSSARYGYDSAMLQSHFPDYEVTNMGVYAYTNAYPQMELILPCLGEGDVLLSAPEFDCLNFQSCESTALDFHFWAMMEADYGCVANLPLTSYTKVFDSLGQYLTLRRDLTERSYFDSPNGYDDDGNDMKTPTYNEYGDFIMPRPNTKMDVMLKFVRPDYTPETFTKAQIDALNREYQRFLDKGVQVLYAYSPRNRSSISEESTPENRAALDALLREELCVPVISKIEDSLISGVYFYVIDSHLSTEGARLFTQKMIEDLKPYL